MKSQANVLLVHGAWADGSSWSKVIPPLLAKGHNVVGVQLPLTSLEDDVAATRTMLAKLTGPTVLVGHSYGGAVITNAARDIDHVKALVFIAAFAPDEGESLDSISRSGEPSRGATAIAPDDAGFLWIDRERFHEAFVADATVEEAQVMAAVQKPLSVSAFTAPSGTPAWRTIPSWYLQATEDQMIPAAAQAFMAERIKAAMSSAPASHAAFMAHADAVVDIISRASGG